MTKIKLCGLSRPCDIEAANRLRPEYIGFVFAPKSRRYVPVQKAVELRKNLAPGIEAVGVFVKEEASIIAKLLNSGVIDMAQLHGDEDEDYVRHLRTLTDKPVMKAFRADGDGGMEEWENSSADYILLDSGSGGTGNVFDWELIRKVKRPYFLAGGLGRDNVAEAIRQLNPYGIDVSSGIETHGWKDPEKMEEFITLARSASV